MPLALAIAFMSALPQYMSYGPFYYWEIVNSQAQLCKENGWRNLLFINNFWSDGEMVSFFLCPSQRLEASRGVYFSSINSNSSSNVFYLPFLKIMKNQELLENLL